MWLKDYWLLHTSHPAAGIDYTAVNIDLVFSESMNKSCVNVSTDEDDILEEDEQFLLDLTTTDPSVELNPDVTTVTIEDDDRMFYLHLMCLTNGIGSQCYICTKHAKCILTG